MTTGIDSARRTFLRGGDATRSPGQQMPWAVAGFVDSCERCDDCISACEEQVVVRGDGGFPVVDFQRGGCTFCGACATACTHGALDAAIEPAWQLRAAIGDDCLSARGITCRSCGDSCDQRAIRFQLQVGGRAMPILDDALCNGCGNCVATCPTHVIHLQEQL